VAKEWRSACGVAVAGRAQLAAQALHEQLGDARAQAAALGAEEERAVWVEGTT
jgi:hypothetical protein